MWISLPTVSRRYSATRCTLLRDTLTDPQERAAVIKAYEAQYGTTHFDGKQFARFMGDYIMAKAEKARDEDCGTQNLPSED